MKKQTIKDIADSFRTFEQMYNDLIEKGPSGFGYCMDYDGIWKRLEISWILESFEKDERYEDCAKIRDIMKVDYIAPESKQIELNARWENFTI